MKIVASLLLSAVALKIPDPFCKNGILSLGSGTDDRACCPSYCGECNDHPTCAKKRGQDSKGACCASEVLALKCGGGTPASKCLKSCKKSVPPCIMEPTEFAMPSAGSRRAGEDCNDAIYDWRRKAANAVEAGITSAGGTPNRRQIVNRLVIAAAPSPPPAPAAAVPQVSAGEPEIAAGAPETGLIPQIIEGATDIAAGVAAGVPQIGAGVPQIGVGVPQIGVGVPQIGAGVPEIGAGMPEIGAGMPAIDAILPDPLHDPLLHDPMAMLHDTALHDPLLHDPNLLDFPCDQADAAMPCGPEGFFGPR